MRGVLVVCGGIVLTTACFLVLPLLQAIGKPRRAELTVRVLDVASLPPPPAPEEEEEKEPEEEEPEPPELEEDLPPLDLAQLELALHPKFVGEGWLGRNLPVTLDTIASTGDALDALFSMSELDQKPRAIYQPHPVPNETTRSKAPGSVQVVFMVTEQGRVENPIVQSSSDPVFEGPALAAVKQWRFEPGKRNGNAVRFRMRVPITFPKGR